MDRDDLPPVELVKQAMKVLGVENPPQLADALGMTGRYQDKTARRWIEGQTAPSYESTLKLLTVVGLLPKQRPAELFSEAEGGAKDARAQAAAVEEETLPLEQPSQEHPRSATGTA